MGTDQEHSQFVAQYEQYKDALLNYLMYRLNFNRPVAEDLFMDIVLKAYESFHRYSPEKGSFKTWLFAIAHNHLVNHWRDQKPLQSVEALEESGITVGVSEPDHRAEQITHQKQIKKVLRYLKDDEREIIALRYLEELELDEMAQVLGKNNGAVRTQLSRALQSFQYYYQKLYPNHEA